MIDRLDYGVWKLRTGMSSFNLYFHSFPSRGGLKVLKKCQRREEAKWFRAVVGREVREDEKGQEEEEKKANIQHEILDGVNTIIKDGSS